MNPHVSVITLGVRDLPRARRFYADGLGWPLEQDYPQWVSFKMGEGSSTLGLYPLEASAADAGLAADGQGFRGVTLNYLVRSEERVAEVLAEAAQAGGQAGAEVLVHPGDLRPPVDLGDLGVAAQAGQEPEHGLGAVAAQVLGHPPEEGTDVGPGVVGDDELLGRPVAVEAGPDELLLGGPAAVDGRQADTRPVGHVLPTELVVADVVEAVEHPPEHVLRPLLRPPAATP